MKNLSNEIVFKAIELATRWHEGVYRKEPIKVKEEISYLPYITHPLEVMKTVWLWRAGDPVVLSAAVCHDLIEDTLCPREFIAAIHPQVLAIVEELTLEVDPALPPNVKAAMKREYMESFKNKSVQSLVCKAADRLKNSQDFAVTNPGYAAKYLDKGLSMFKAVADRGTEIVDQFGTYTLDAILNEHSHLQELLGASPIFHKEV